MSIAETLERAKNKGWLESPSESSDRASRFDQVGVNLDSSIASGTQTAVRSPSVASVHQPGNEEPNSFGPLLASADPDVDEIDELFSDLLRDSSIACGTQTAVNQPGNAEPNSIGPLHASADPDVDEIDELFSDLLRYSPDTSIECPDPQCERELNQNESFLPSQDLQSASSFTVVDSSDCLDSHSCQSELKKSTTCEEAKTENHSSVNEGRKNNSLRQSKLSIAEEKQKKWQEWQNAAGSCGSVPCENSSAGAISVRKSGFVFGSKISFGLNTKAERSNGWKSREAGSTLEGPKQEEIEPLMEGWHERWSKSKSKVYYANKVTCETRWERPTASSLGAPIHSAAKSIAADASALQGPPGNGGKQVPELSHITIGERPYSYASAPQGGSTDLSLMNQDRRCQQERQALELVEMRTLEVQMNALKKRLQSLARHRGFSVLLVPDTNCFIHHLDQMELLRRLQGVSVIVPYMVSRELDSLKRRGGDIEAAARLATKWLLQAIQAGQPSGSLRAQAEGEHAANVPQQNADDSVLACAAYFHNLFMHQTEEITAGLTPHAILVTEDVGLKLKASMLEIRVQSAAEVLAALC